MKININTAAGQERRLLYSLPLAVFLLVFLFFISCSPKNDEAMIIPPVTFPLSMPYIAYGVINASYIQLSYLPGEIYSSGNISTGYLRKGDIVNIVERKLENREGKTQTWVLVEGESKGWVKESLVDIYGNESQAKNASQLMRLN